MTGDTALIALVATMYGLYEIVHGVVTSRRYGLRFLLVGGLLTGLPMLMVTPILLFGGGRSIWGWEYLVLVVWVLGVAWETWHKRKLFRRQRDELELTSLEQEGVDNNE